MTVRAIGDVSLKHGDTIHLTPRANEILVAVAVTDSGRPLPRVGGLTKDEAKGEDGLR